MSPHLQTWYSNVWFFLPRAIPFALYHTTFMAIFQDKTFFDTFFAKFTLSGLPRQRQIQKKCKTPFFTFVAASLSRKDSPLATKFALPESAEEVAAPFSSSFFGKKNRLQAKCANGFCFLDWVETRQITGTVPVPRFSPLWCCLQPR